MKGVVIAILVSYWVPIECLDLQRIQVSQLPECPRLDLSDSVKAKIPGEKKQNKKCIYIEKYAVITGPVSPDSVPARR